VERGRLLFIAYWRALLYVHLLLLVSIERKCKRLYLTIEIYVNQSNENFPIGTVALHGISNFINCMAVSPLFHDNSGAKREWKFDWEKSGKGLWISKSTVCGNYGLKVT